MHRLPILLVVIFPTLAQAVPPFPGGVLDTTERTAYVATEAGIDAVDLARGELLWQSHDAHLPVLVAGGRLYALGLHEDNRLTVVAFDLASKAERVFKTDVTGLPRWVTTRGTVGHTFHCDWQRAGSTLILDWAAEARGETGPAKHADGQVRIDLDTGRVNPAVVALRAPRAPDRLPVQLEKKSLRWYGRSGGQLLAVVLEDLPDSTLAARKQRFVFRGWDARTGKEGTPRELLRGSRLVLMTDLDGKHVWLRDSAGSDDPFAPRFWWVFSVLDGHLVAKVPFVPGTQVVTRLGLRAYCLSSALAKTPLDGTAPRRRLMLHALDLEEGKVAWTRPLGEPAER